MGNVVSNFVVWVCVIFLPICIGLIVAQGGKIREVNQERKRQELRCVKEVERVEEGFRQQIEGLKGQLNQALTTERELRETLTKVNKQFQELASRPAQVVDSAPLIEQMGEAMRKVAWGGVQQQPEPLVNILPDKEPDLSNIPQWHPPAEDDEWLKAGIQTELEIDNHA